MNVLEFKLLSLIANVKVARNIIQAFLIEYDVDIAFIEETKTIISEAVTNCIIHGYENNPKDIITIKAKIKNNILELVIVDNGIGIKDVELAKTAMYTSKECDERSGLGLTIIDVFSNEFELYSSVGEGTTVFCKKELISIECEKVA